MRKNYHLVFVVRLACLILLLKLTIDVNCQSLQVNQMEVRELHMLNKQSESGDIISVLRLLEDCPKWSNTAIDNKFTRKIILQYLNQVSQYHVLTIRKAVVFYVQNSNQLDKQYHSNLSTIFVLNRYLFKAPIKGPDNISFGGWVGASTDNTSVNWLWPLVISNDGNLELTGTLDGYAGPAYRAIEEFDYFNKTFGLRKLPTK